MKLSENVTSLGNSGFKPRSWIKQNKTPGSHSKSNRNGSSGDLLMAFGISDAALKGFLFIFYVYLFCVWVRGKGFWD